MTEYDDKRFRLLALNDEEIGMIFQLFKYASFTYMMEICGEGYTSKAREVVHALLNNKDHHLVCKTPGCDGGMQGYLEDGYCRVCLKRAEKDMTLFELLDRRICTLAADVHVMKRMLGKGDDNG